MVHVMYYFSYLLSSWLLFVTEYRSTQYCYSYVHNTNITVNVLLFIIKQLTLCLVKMTKQEDQKHIFNFVWPKVLLDSFYLQILINAYHF